MMLVADSGSTKTDWILVDDNGDKGEVFTTPGLNPNIVRDEKIKEIITANRVLLSLEKKVSKLFFYGAGCTLTANRERLKNIFLQIFPAATIDIYSDIDGAVRSVCDEDAAIVCILGTGSNACYYDGKKISGAALSIGYILGDEGSGSYFGKRLLRDYFYGLLPEDLAKLFNEKFAVTREDIINKIYRGTAPSEYLASFLPFYKENINHSWCRFYLNNGIDEFLKIFVWRFEQFEKVQTHFIGSVAYHFHELIEDKCRELKIIPGVFLQSPVTNLADFHIRLRHLPS